MLDVVLALFERRHFLCLSAPFFLGVFSEKTGYCVHYEICYD